MADSEGQRNGQFTFYLSSDINLPVRVKLDRLCGRIGEFAAQHARGVAQGLPPLHDASPPARPLSLYCEAVLCAYGERISQPIRSADAGEEPAGAKLGHTLAFPTKYRDLPHNSQLAVTVWANGEGRARAAVGAATLQLFSRKGRLKTGRQRLRLWRGGLEADVSSPSATPAKVALAERGQAGRLEWLRKRYCRGELERVGWLDALTLKELERLRWQDMVAAEAAGQLDLYVELPDFAHAVIFHQQAQQHTASERLVDSGTVAGREGREGGGLALLHDPEVGRENPAELKAQKLARSLTRGVIDRDLKPDTEERRDISAILLYPPNRPLSAEDQGVLWRFRYSLTADKRALTKFLKCVDWGDAHEARQAADLMQQWAGIDIADALELLSPDFTNQEVRAHAVEVLQRADDEELLYYLLQLVQALRYEAADDSRLARFIVSRAAANRTMGIFLHWYLYVEWEDPGFGPRAGFVHKLFQDSLPPGSPTIDAISRQMGLVAQLHCIVKELKSTRASAARKAERLREMVGEGGPLGELVHLQVPLPLDPSTLLLGIVPNECGVFKSALAPLRLTFRTDAPASSPAHPAFSPAQQHGSAGRDASAGPPGGLAGPVTSIGRLSGEGRYMVIYKKGDDLRQDQLVVQMFSLMDRLLKRENLDLKLTPYKVLPTSDDDGMIECVPECAPLARVLADHRTITKYLAQFHTDPAGPFGLSPECLGNFVRSCAGYCVMTYILGVGDRHLDNLMLVNDGRLFHIDFGYILGRDPKPFPPPMKLCKEMVDAMGGPDSVHYNAFRTLCCEAYNILRKSANLILSLFHLMAGAPIPDVRDDPEKAMLKLQEKLRLDLDDEGAVEWMQLLLNESATALMPQIMETTHRWAQYWR